MKGLNNISDSVPFCFFKIISHFGLLSLAWNTWVSQLETSSMPACTPLISQIQKDLARLLYLFQTPPPKAEFSRHSYGKWGEDLGHFLWAGQTHRINRLLLKFRGGIGLPDVFNYHKATYMNHILEWCMADCIKQWVQMEQASWAYLWEVSHSSSRIEVILGDLVRKA